jgi:hypothetical protein
MEECKMNPGEGQEEGRREGGRGKGGMTEEQEREAGG